MATRETVLLVGGTGRTGRRTLQQLLGRGIQVRAIVRASASLPPEVAGNPGLTVIEASLLALPDEELRRLLQGCDAVVSCLGHVVSWKGVLGPPWALVTEATKRLCRGIEALRPPAPVRFVLISSVSVNRPGGLDERRSAFERAFLWLLRGVLPPARDNQRAADFLLEEIGTSHAFVQWAVVRPDSLLEGEVSEYTLHEGLVNALFEPGSTNMANVAHFMCELATSQPAWAEWKGKLPVIVNAAASKGTAAKPGRGTVKQSPPGP